jgi:hypothetical protein
MNFNLKMYHADIVTFNINKKTDAEDHIILFHQVNLICTTFEGKTSNIL